MSFYTDTSRFWRYFRDTLATTFLSAPGALTVLAQGLARSLDTVRRDVRWTLDQFVPPRAEDAHIPLHGASRGVPRTRFDTGARYRVRVERAASWHRLGGKTRGLPEICRDYGYDSGQVYNCRQDNPALWAHFDLRLLNPPADFSQTDVDAVFALANQYKAARSVINKIQFAREQQAPLALGAAGQTRIILDHRVTAKEARLPGPATLALGATLHTLYTVEHFVLREAL